MSQAQIEKKVENYLRNSQALENYWQRPLTAEELQAEIDRMAQHTKRPEVLDELFKALGEDPSVIAECLARLVLANRLVTNLIADDAMQSLVRHGRAGLRMDSSQTTAELRNYSFPKYRRRRDALMTLGLQPA